MFRFRSGIAFAVLCVGFVAGVAAGSFEVAWWIPILIFCGGGLICLFLKKNSCRWQDACLFLFVFLFASWGGFSRYSHVQPTIQSVAVVADGEKHDVEGVVVRREEDDANSKLTLLDVRIDGEAREDRVLVKTSLFTEVHVGDVVRFSCKLKRPEAFEDFAYDRYLAAKDIVATCSLFYAPDVVGSDTHMFMRFLATIDALHAFIVRQIVVVLPQPHAQLLAGLLLGDDAFSSVWKERFLRTGTSHIVAASGSNVALTVSLLLAVLFAAGVRRRYATVLVLFGIAIFVLLAGGESAVMRAGIMASLVVIARATGRASSVRNVLLCTVCLMLWCEPRILRSDVGFQLSVLSTVGLVWWSRIFIDRFAFLPERFGIREGFATTLAATLATLPVTAFGMGQISLVGPFANLLVLPLLPLAMAAGTCAIVVGMLAPAVGRVIAFPVWWMLDVVLFVLRELSLLPFAYLEVKGWMFDGALGVGGAIVGVVRRFIALFPSRRSEPRVSSLFLPVLLFGGLFFAALFQHVVRDGWFSSTVRVWVFDVGQGDALFIDTPEKDVVIDAGPNTLLLEKLGSVLPWFDHSLHFAFATHPDADHVTGFLSLFSSYSVEYLGESGQGCDTFFCMPFARAEVPRMVFAQGDALTLSPGVTLSFVSPAHTYSGEILDDANTDSLVMLLQTPSGSMLFTGDADDAAEARYAPFLSHVDVLKLGHHGSASSTSSLLLEKITPTFGIVSAGEGNRYGHPRAEVLERLAVFGVTVFRTDTQGDIRIEFGENGVHVSAVSL